MADNGITRREFERLERRVDALQEQGTPAGRLAGERLAGELAGIRAELGGVKTRVSGLVRVGLGILTALLAGLVTLVTALITQAVGG